MEVIIYYLLCLLARKKLIVNVSYFIGTAVFVSLSYNTANQLYKIPNGIQLSLAKSSENISQPSNNSFRYGNRSEFLTKQCNNSGEPNRQAISSLVRHSNMLNHLGFVLRSQSLFYCSVPKVATRTFLTYITYLHIRNELLASSTNNSASYFYVNTERFDTNYINQMLSSSIQNNSTALLSLFLSQLKMSYKSNSTRLDLWSMYQKKALPYIRLRTLSDPSIIFSTSFTRIIFVRHPLERLASAYEDKIASRKAEPFSTYDNLRRAICLKYSSSYLTPSEQKSHRIHRTVRGYVNEACSKIIPTFEHFVDYIMTESAQVDVHWQPYSTLCHACTFKYNFIGKYETIQEDLNVLRTQLGLNATDWDVDNYFSTGKSKQNYISLYSKLPNHLICNLKDFYQQDFKLFDYQIEDYLADHQKVNCPSQHYGRFKV